MKTITPLRTLPHWSWLPSAETIQRFSRLLPPLPKRMGWQFKGEMFQQEFIAREIEYNQRLTEEAVRRRISRGYYKGLKSKSDGYRVILWVEE